MLQYNILIFSKKYYYLTIVLEYTLAKNEKISQNFYFYWAISMIFKSIFLWLLRYLVWSVCPIVIFCIICTKILSKFYIVSTYNRLHEYIVFLYFNLNQSNELTHFQRILSSVALGKEIFKWIMILSYIVLLYWYEHF